MKKLFVFTISSIINLDRNELWNAVANMQGVNDELAPFVKMAVPFEYRNFTIQDAPVGKKLFKSIILLFKFFPIDIHHFKLDKVTPNEGFEENSTSLMHQFWKHKRTLLYVNGGTKITDTVQFYPRLPLIGYLLKPVYQFVFKYRHKRLSNKFNIRT